MWILSDLYPVVALGFKEVILSLYTSKLRIDSKERVFQSLWKSFMVIVFYIKSFFSVHSLDCAVMIIFRYLNWNLLEYLFLLVES